MTAPRIPRHRARISVVNLFVYVIEPIAVVCLVAACTALLTGCGGGGDSGLEDRAAHDVPTPGVNCAANPKACI